MAGGQESLPTAEEMQALGKMIRDLSSMLRDAAGDHPTRHTMVCSNKPTGCRDSPACSSQVINIAIYHGATPPCQDSKTKSPAAKTVGLYLDGACGAGPIVR